MKNLYKILNMADLEQALISAAYSKSKSDLLKQKSSLVSEEVYKNRLQEIEQAYFILSNKALKLDYDLDFLQSQKRAMSPDQSSANHKTHAQAPAYSHPQAQAHALTQSHPNDPGLSKSCRDHLSADWLLAIEHFPLIAVEYDRLSKFDEKLAKTYQNELQTKGLYKDSTALKDRMEKAYFQSLYGRNTSAIAYAKKLLLNKWRPAAEKFNASLRLLGHVVPIADLMVQIEREFEPVKKGFNYTQFFEALKKDKCSAGECVAFIESFFQIKVEARRFLFDQTFSFYIEDENIYLHHADDLRGFLKTYFLNFKKRDVPDNPFIMGR